MFSNGGGVWPQIITWYAGLIDVIGFAALAAGDTMASHAGWKENVQYSGNRPTWVNTQGSQQVSSNGPFTFPVTGNGAIHGLFITSSPTPSGSTGVLWATAILSSDAVITAGQSVTGTYQALFSGG